MSRQTSTRLSERKQNQLKSVGDKSESQIASINELVDDLTSGRQINGIFNMNVLVYTQNDNDFQTRYRKPERRLLKRI